MEATEKSRLKIKVGDFELDTEGPADVVKAQFETFMKLVSAQPSPPRVAPLDKPDSDKSSASGDTGNAGSLVPRVAIDRALLEHVFRQEATFVSLMALPKSETARPDALLALIYGQGVFKGEKFVSGTTLAKAALKSGLQIDRVDRVIDKHEAYIVTSGMKKGKRYGLNNPGTQRAEEIIRGLLN